MFVGFFEIFEGGGSRKKAYSIARGEFWDIQDLFDTIQKSLLGILK